MYKLVSAAEGPRRSGGEGQGGTAGGALPPLREEVFISRELKLCLILMEDVDLVSIPSSGEGGGAVETVLFRR